MGEYVRQSNIELLRIISMFMVILSHYYCHSSFPYSGGLNFNEIMMIFLASGGKIAVNVFVIISGYFLVEQTFSWKKLLKFFSCTYFWSIVVLLFAIGIFGLSNINPSFVKKSLIPLTPVNWFARAYLHLYIIFPLLNKIIYKLNEQKIKYVIMALTVVFFIIPTIKNIALGGYLSALFMFSDLYLIGAYLKLYSNAKLENYTTYSGILGLLAILASIMFFTIIGGTKEQVMSYGFSGANVFALMTSIGMFVVFKNMRIGYSKFINGIAATSFAVYLIHDNALISGWLWNSIVNGADFYNSPCLILHMLMASVCIFAVCSLMDYLRINYFEKPIMKIVR